MKRLIIDTDPGVDDAQAITMALRSDDIVEVVAITTCHGNVPVDQNTSNLRHILKANNRTKIPVFVGATCPLISGRILDEHYHGKDGLGDVFKRYPLDPCETQAEHAVNALIRIVNKNVGELTLVCLGPLTNVALAIRLDPDFGSKLKNCVIMGGNHEAKGNRTASAEFNFCADPEAARIVLRDLRCRPITLITWELCSRLSFTWEWYEQFINTDSSLGRFFKMIESKTVKTHFSDKSSYMTCDPVAMAIVIDPEVIIRGRRLHCDVELTGKLTRGQGVVDWKGINKERENVLLVEDINFERFKELMMLIVSDAQGKINEENGHCFPWNGASKAVLVEPSESIFT